MDTIATCFDTRKHHINYFKRWKSSLDVALPKRMLKEKDSIEKADKFASKHVPRRFLCYWKKFVAHQKEIRWKEYRKECLRKSVKSMLTNSSFEHQLQTTSMSLADIIG